MSGSEDIIYRYCRPKTAKLKGVPELHGSNVDLTPFFYIAKGYSIRDKKGNLRQEAQTACYAWGLISVPASAQS